MGKIEGLYRRQRQVLRWIFVCSIIFLAFFLIPTFFSFLFPNYVKHEDFWLRLRNAGGLTILLLCLGLIIRYLHLRLSTKKNTSLIQAVNDERIRISWLKAYRFAFYFMVGIHASLIFGPYMYVIDKFHLLLPHAEWMSLAVGLPALFGAVLYFSREGSHD